MSETAFLGALYHYRANLVRVIDGDTILVDVSLGMLVYRRTSIRIRGINAPELFSGEDRDAGAASRDHLTELLTNARDGTLSLQTYKDGKSFDRYVADVFYVDALGEWVDVGERMRWDGFAVLWP